ncbi:Hypothetical protein FKW44_015707 [Caligus rogercresseyi]|uniref:Uncharacterized protein n=1 Tax=Caligus rogercresseyi TaxID=217165 RepID=A0A7T8H1G3_CALRO|nr:Hypothetical protein FKW44_015707 [Caligus rogercresseyi]
MGPQVPRVITIKYWSSEPIVQGPSGLAKHNYDILEFRTHRPWAFGLAKHNYDILGFHIHRPWTPDHNFDIWRIQTHRPSVLRLHRSQL